MADHDTQEGKAKLFDELMGDKSVRRQVLRALSPKHPDVVVPELEAEDMIVQVTKPLQETIAKLQDDLKSREFERGVLDQKRDIQSRYKLSDEQVTEVEKLMTDKKIGDYGTAVEHMRLSKQSATPTPTVFESRTMTPPDKAGEFFKNPISTARKAAIEALNELRSRDAA